SRVPVWVAPIQCNRWWRKRLADCGTRATWRINVDCRGAATSVSSGLDGHGHGGQVKLERERRAAPGAGCDLELRAHRGDELVADGEAKSGAREVVPCGGGRLPERLEQRPERLGVEARAGVAHRELDHGAVELARHDFDGALLRELEGVGG